MSLIAASGGKQAQITVSLRSPWQRLHWWASLKLRQRRNHKSSLVCILNNEVLILKFVDTLVQAFIHVSPLNSYRRSQKKLRKSFLFLPALFSILLQKCSLFFLGRLTEGGQQLSQYTDGLLLQKELQRTHYCQIWQNRSKGWEKKASSLSLMEETHVHRYLLPPKHNSQMSFLIPES